MLAYMRIPMTLEIFLDSYVYIYFRWFVTPWTSCSKTCGLGRKKRKVSCKAQMPNGTWSERLLTDCPMAEKPIPIHTCVQKACFLSWRKTTWSKVDILSLISFST